MLIIAQAGSLPARLSGTYSLIEYKKSTKTEIDNPSSYGSLYGFQVKRLRFIPQSNINSSPLSRLGMRLNPYKPGFITYCSFFYQHRMQGLVNRPRQNPANAGCRHRNGRRQGRPPGRSSYGSSSNPLQAGCRPR